MTRFARARRVYFVEEPVFLPAITPRLAVDRSGEVTVVVPQLTEGSDAKTIVAQQRTLLDAFRVTEGIRDFVSWYYTPMALAFTDHWTPVATVYDCMDELSGFKGAPASIKEREADLMRRASLMLTGGQSLFEAKRDAHRNVHLFPSSVDVAHFSQARKRIADPPDQALLARPRLGYVGVIDERMDLELLDGVAQARPDWQIVMVGPVVKIDPDSLPRRANLHYLGSKPYQALPRYLAGWDVALLPFARNDATRFISPTKTPEYLAAGKPVVSTSIRDVVRPYGAQGLARIADDVRGFVAACSAALAENRTARMAQADAFLAGMSWDDTCNQIQLLLDDVVDDVAIAPASVATAFSASPVS